MTFKNTLTAGTLAAVAVVAFAPSSHAFSFGDVTGFFRGGESRPAIEDRVPPFAEQLTDDQRTTFEGLDTREDKRAYLEELGIDMPERGERRGNNSKGFGQKMMEKMGEPSEEVQALLDELRTAYEAGDEDRVTELRTEIQEIRQTERDANDAEKQAALDAGYDAWVAYMTEHGKTEILEKITVDNFDTFVELHEARERVRTLQAELGLEQMMHR